MTARGWMRLALVTFLTAVLAASARAQSPQPAPAAEQVEAPLPAGVKAVWDIDKAYSEKTPTRERICLNGLWRWQGADKKTDAVPTGGWGFAKVPGTWPGIGGDYMWRESQTYYPNSAWPKDLGKFTMAWHQREFTIPADWNGRRIAVSMEYINSIATVFVDGKKVGEALFPGGEVDITSACRAGDKQVLSIFVAAVPLGEESIYFAEAWAPQKSKAEVRLKGLCGDVFLVGTPAKQRIADVKVDTSVRKWQITFDAAVQPAAPDATYTLRANVTDGGKPVKEFTSKPFKGADIQNGRFAFTSDWKAPKLWDTITPANQYEVSLSLLDGAGKVLDTFGTVRFGFRELWIDGRDFYLNGTRIYCFVLPVDSAAVSTASASYDGAMETFRRLKDIGVNLVYTHNYGCEPGTHLGFGEILRAADDSGMLVSFSMPHMSAYNWKAADADATNGYARHAEFYVRAAQNHPSVVMYSMNHNQGGYYEMHNPDRIDGKLDINGKPGERTDGTAKLAMRTQAIVQKFDSSRAIYHHSGGNLGQMYTLNIYLNMVPIQEKSDWFEHWATEGVKPLFLCEYGTPSDVDWTTFRGYQDGKRYFWNGQIRWEQCFPEWGSQFRGDKAYDITEKEKVNLRFEADKWKKGSRGWFRWDYKYNIPEQRFDIPNILDVQAMYIADNWRAFRTWGVTVMNCWEHHRIWTLKEGVNPPKRLFRVDWEKLQRPGFSPDFIDRQFDQYEYGFEQSDWIATPAAQAFVRNNQPVLAYIADGPPHFTGKEHNYTAGQQVSKQIIVINNSRRLQECEVNWSLNLPKAVKGSKKFTVQTGQQERIELKLDLPADLKAGRYEIAMTCKFDNAPAQSDSFMLDVTAKPAAAKIAGKIGIFDPKGETSKLLKDLGVQAQPVDAAADLAGYDMLIIGKEALTVDGPGPNLARVRDGLKVIVFEQTADVLEKRLGFRATEYGLRNVFKRVSDYPMLAGVTDEQLTNWRGQSTIVPPRLAYKPQQYKDPTIQWCGVEVTRPWRAGNWGNVASVLIEKPACGDFLPIIDGGFSLQYSPLMEYREGKGMVIFCQLDVSGRTTVDSTAQQLAVNILQYAAAWKPSASRTLLYAGEPAGMAHLQKLGVAVAPYGGGEPKADAVLLIGPGAADALGKDSAALSKWVADGGHIFAVGLSDKEMAALPLKVTTAKAEYIAAAFAPQAKDSPIAGIGPADTSTREPRQLPLTTGGADAVGKGVLATAQKGGVVIFELAPWQFDYAKQYNLKRTFRRSSFVVTRVLGNLGVALPTPLLDRFAAPVTGDKPEKRCLQGLYLDQPEEMDDPYRYFCW